MLRAVGTCRSAWTARSSASGWRAEERQRRACSCSQRPQAAPQSLRSGPRTATSSRAPGRVRPVQRRRAVARHRPAQGGRRPARDPRTLLQPGHRPRRPTLSSAASYLPSSLPLGLCELEIGEPLPVREAEGKVGEEGAVGGLDVPHRRLVLPARPAALQRAQQELPRGKVARVCVRRGGIGEVVRVQD